MSRASAQRVLFLDQYARRVSAWRPDTTLSWGTSPAVTADLAPRVDPDTSLPLAHLFIAGEVVPVPPAIAVQWSAPSGRCCDPDSMADGRLKSLDTVSQVSYLAYLAQQLSHGQLDNPAWAGTGVVLKTRPVLGVAQEVPQTGVP